MDKIKFLKAVPVVAEINRIESLLSAIKDCDDRNFLHYFSNEIDFIDVDISPAKNILISIVNDKLKQANIKLLEL